MQRFRRLCLLALMLGLVLQTAVAGVTATLRGKVIDARTGEALVGATVRVVQTQLTAVTDGDGLFSIAPLAQRNYTLTASYLGYHKAQLSVNPARQDTLLIIRMNELESNLGAATVTVQAKRNTETAQVAAEKNSLVVQSGISAQQISKSQDKDASEVMRRVPGISIIDQKFVMVRGLSQRYNNVWINGAAVPSSEPDSRAFSFDIIPSSQVDNMQIVKSPAPQYPADFTGGFILIDTKEVPNENSARISVGASVNDQSHFRTFLAPKGGATDFLGFDCFRSLKGGLHAVLPQTPGGRGISLADCGLSNDWTIHRHTPWADLSLSADVNRSRELQGGALIAL